MGAVTAEPRWDWPPELVRTVRMWFINDAWANVHDSPGGLTFGPKTTAALLDALRADVGELIAAVDDFLGRFEVSGMPSRRPALPKESALSYARLREALERWRPQPEQGGE